MRFKLYWMFILVTLFINSCTTGRYGPGGYNNPISNILGIFAQEYYLPYTANPHALWAILGTFILITSFVYLLSHYLGHFDSPIGRKVAIIFGVIVAMFSVLYSDILDWVTYLGTGFGWLLGVFFFVMLGWALYTFGHQVFSKGATLQRGWASERIRSHTEKVGSQLENDRKLLERAQDRSGIQAKLMNRQQGIHDRLNKAVLKEDRKEMGNAIKEASRVTDRIVGNQQRISRIITDLERRVNHLPPEFPNRRQHVRSVRELKKSVEDLGNKLAAYRAGVEQMENAIKTGDFLEAERLNSGLNTLQLPLVAAEQKVLTLEKYCESLYEGL